MEQILAKHLSNVGLAVAAAEHFVRDKRHVFCSVHASWKKRNAVEVGSEPDVIYPRDIPNMIDVIDDPRVRSNIDGACCHELSLGFVETLGIILILFAKGGDLIAELGRTLVLFFVGAG